MWLQRHEITIAATIRTCHQQYFMDVVGSYSPHILWVKDLKQVAGTAQYVSRKVSLLIDRSIYKSRFQLFCLHGMGREQLLRFSGLESVWSFGIQSQGFRLLCPLFGRVGHFRPSSGCFENIVSGFPGHIDFSARKLEEIGPHTMVRNWRKGFLMALTQSLGTWKHWQGVNVLLKFNQVRR